MIFSKSAIFSIPRLRRVQLRRHQKYGPEKDELVPSSDLADEYDKLFVDRSEEENSNMKDEKSLADQDKIKEEGIKYEKEKALAKIQGPTPVYMVDPQYQMNYRPLPADYKPESGIDIYNLKTLPLESRFNRWLVSNFAKNKEQEVMLTHGLPMFLFLLFAAWLMSIPATNIFRKRERERDDRSYSQIEKFRIPLHEDLEHLRSQKLVAAGFPPEAQDQHQKEIMLDVRTSAQPEWQTEIIPFDEEADLGGLGFEDESLKGTVLVKCLDLVDPNEGLRQRTVDRINAIVLIKLTQRT